MGKKTVSVTVTYTYRTCDNQEINAFNRDMADFQGTREFKNKLTAVGKSLAATKVTNDWIKNNEKK